VNAAKPFRDHLGKTLEEYPHPSLAVDVAVLTLTPDPCAPRLAVLLVPVKRAALFGGQWALPGTFLHQGETLADAVARALAVKVGFSGLRPAQLGVFDAPGRDPRGWVVSAAHLAAVPIEMLEDLVGEALGSFERAPGEAPKDARRGTGSVPGELAPAPGAARADEANAPHSSSLTGAALFPVDSMPLPLAFDHAEMVAAAVKALRAEYDERPDPRGFLDEPFTLRQLRAVHQAVGAPGLLPDTFRRRMAAGLDRAGLKRVGGRGKPAEQYRRHASVARSDPAGNRVSTAPPEDH
jgi:ADP-ribose pyrophosphatase YjhB (NUDIX family)